MARQPYPQVAHSIRLATAAPGSQEEANQRSQLIKTVLKSKIVRILARTLLKPVVIGKTASAPLSADPLDSVGIITYTLSSAQDLLKAPVTS